MASPLICVVTGFLITGALILLCQKGEIRMARKDCYFLVRERLNGYALMKVPCAVIYHPPCNNLQFVPSAMLLSHHQHDILLGALKKVEVKSAGAAVLVTFTLTAIGVPEMCNRSEWAGHVQFFTIGVLIAALFASLDNAAHLGQPHFRRLTKGVEWPVWGRELQRELLEDMLKKEATFAAFRCVAIAVALLLLLSAFVALIEPCL